MFALTMYKPLHDRMQCQELIGCPPDLGIIFRHSHSAVNEVYIFITEYLQLYQLLLFDIPPIGHNAVSSFDFHSNSNFDF